MDLRYSNCKHGKALRREWTAFKRRQAPLFNDVELPPVYWNGRLKRAYGRTVSHRQFGMKIPHKIDLNTGYKRPSVPMKHFKETIRHEFIHLIATNHGPEFQRIARSEGVKTYAQHSLPTRKRNN